MTGCLPQDPAYQPPHAFYTLASDIPPEGTASSCHSVHSHQLYPGQTSATVPHPAHSHSACDYPSHQRPYRVDPTVSQAIGIPVSADPTAVQSSCHQSRQQSGVRLLASQAQKGGQPALSGTSAVLHPSFPGSAHFAQVPSTAVSQYTRVSETHGQWHHPGNLVQTARVQQQQSAGLPQPVATQRPPHGQCVRTTVSQYQPSDKHSPQYRPVEQHSYRDPTETTPLELSFPRPAVSSAQWQHSGRPLEALHSFTGPPPLIDISFLTLSSASPQHPGQHSEGAGALKSVQQTSNQQEQERPAVTTSLCHPSFQRSPLGSPSTMLDKKPSLQMVADRSPVSPSSTSSPRFVYPETQTSSSSSSSGHLASSSGSSPFMAHVKQEVQWEVGTPPRSSDMDPAMLQAYGDRRSMLSGGSEGSETLADSETGSSVLEDSSSSSREQSPFCTMAKSLSLHSPEHPSSPLTRKALQHETVIVASQNEELGEETDRGSGAHTFPLPHDSDFPKFKRRLHERYMLSLKDTSEIPHKIKEEFADRYERSHTETHSFSTRPMPKLERCDCPAYSESYMPKSPRRSSSDTDIAHTQSIEMGTASTNEGDVFMESTIHERTKSKPPSLHQREPLDLSRGHSGFRSSSGSSPLLDPEHFSPASKLISPVFRSPHRLPYSPHGLMSPQSQSPLCPVPEGGRIFSFNVPSPLEGAHSDSDLISPSPVSPRVFTFPPHGSLPHPMSEASRLALSPRAPYTPPPSFMRGKPFVGGSFAHSSKWGDEPGFYSKRSLSESDMTYLCPLCGQVLPSNDSLAKHMAKHLPSETLRSGDTKIHYCKVCSRSFSRSDMLTRHMRLHTGLKPYECFDCGQVFSRSDHLNTHRRTHTGEKPYRCPHCPYAACRRDMITRHMRTHAKRTSRRSRYLSVPDEGDGYKPSGSVSSTDRTDSQDFSVGGHTCSVSSMESMDSESVHSSHPPYLGASVDSLLSPDQDQLSGGLHSSPTSRKMSEEGMEGRMEGSSSYDRFMQYRRGRNWSTTSLESVDSEEVIREVLVDDAFLDPDLHPPGPGKEDRRKDEAGEGGTATSSAKSADLVGLEAQDLQKCFISSQSPGKHSS